MIKKGDTVIYNGETVKVMATPETVHSGDPKYYLIEDYSGGWYPVPGQPQGIYSVNTQKKYYWVIDPKHLLLVNSAITAGMYRILDTHNVRNYLRGKDVIGQLVTVSSKEAELLNEGRTVILDKNKWGINFVAGDLSRATDIPVEIGNYKLGERVIYNGSEALIARVDAGNMYVVQLFNGQGWLGEAHAGLSPTSKYWAVSGLELKPSPVQTKIPVETPYRVTIPRSPRIDPVHYGYGSMAGMMSSMIDPYHDEKRAESSRVERSLMREMERDYQRQRAKSHYEKVASLGMDFHTGINVLLSDLAEKKSDKPVTNQPPDSYIQQPIIVTKRKTKHSLTTV